MSAAEESVSADRARGHLLDDCSWKRLRILEAEHQNLLNRHEQERRLLAAVLHSQGPELRQAWRSYCKLVAALDRTTAELETLRCRACTREFRATR